MVGTTGKEPSSLVGDIKRRGFDSGSARSHGEGLETHSSIYAWRIPCSGEPGRLQSSGSQKLDILKQQHAHMHGIGADMDTVIKWTETAPKHQHLKSR